jgi:hypothetical protein
MLFSQPLNTWLTSRTSPNLVPIGYADILFADNPMRRSAKQSKRTGKHGFRASDHAKNRSIIAPDQRSEGSSKRTAR